MVVAGFEDGLQAIEGCEYDAHQAAFTVIDQRCSGQFNAIGTQRPLIRVREDNAGLDGLGFQHSHGKY